MSIGLEMYLLTTNDRVFGWAAEEMHAAYYYEMYY